jgi:hypothetical protein
MQKNTYRIKNIGIGETVKVYFDPYDLTYVYIYHKEKYIDKVKAYKITNPHYKKIPEELSGVITWANFFSRILFVKSWRISF